MSLQENPSVASKNTARIGTGVGTGPGRLKRPLDDNDQTATIDIPSETEDEEYIQIPDELADEWGELYKEIKKEGQELQERSDEKQVPNEKLVKKCRTLYKKLEKEGEEFVVKREKYLEKYREGVKQSLQEFYSSLEVKNPPGDAE